MEWFLPAIFASLFWGIGQTFIKKGLSDVSPFVSNILIATLTFVSYVPFTLLGGIHWGDFPGILLFGFLDSLPNFTFPYIIQKANVSLAGTVFATYPIYTIILSVLFLHESLTFIQLGGILSVIIGMVVLAKPEGERFKLSTWIIWALVGSIVVGLGDFIGKLALTKYDLHSFLFSLALGAIPSLLLFRIFDRSVVSFPRKTKGLRASILGNLLMPLGLLLLYVAFSKGPASLASPVASTYPAITVLLAYLYLKERINRNQLIGILVVVLGVVSLGI